MSHQEIGNSDSDKYEVIAAFVLGLAAVGSALAGFEANQWGSTQLEAYGDANRLTTQAAAEYNEAVVAVNNDFAAVAQAKAHVIAARDARSGAERAQNLEIASYIYTTMLSEKAYRAFEFPMKYYVEDNAPGADTERAGAPQDEDIPDELLLESLEDELDDDYVDAMTAAPEGKFKEADARFKEGGKCDNIGDMFDLAGIAYAISLFFGGIGVIFRTKTRWTVLGISAFIFAAASLFLLFQPWTL
ncbi:MAG: hypothetical protein AAB229_08570 [Candidatus Hydrogenedentota bacterium]